MSTSTYHHGDLRRALIQAALAQLAAGGAQSVGLREAARAVGVSPSAPYRHFASRAGLLSAVSAEGFKRFHDALRAARDADRANGLAAMGRAYVAFALDNPALFRLMFSPESPHQADPLLADQSRAALVLLAEAVGAPPGEAAGKDPMGVGIIGAWALVHGLAQLLLDRQIPDTDPARTAALVDAVTERWSLAAG